MSDSRPSAKAGRVMYLQLLRQEMATKVDLADLRQEFALLRKDLEVLSGG